MTNDGSPPHGGGKGKPIVPAGPELPSLKHEAGMAAIAAIPEIVACIKILVKGYAWRKQVDAILDSIDAVHSLNMDKVDKLLSILDSHGREMSPKVRDEFYLHILKLCEVAKLDATMPKLP